MNLGMHGKAVERAFMGDEVLTAGSSGGRLEMCATHHGDRDEFWILQLAPDGTEIARFNARHIDSIFWTANGGDGNG